MLAIITFFLAASLWLYILFGGADFGAGILELFTRKKNLKISQNITYQAIGPVWEANHIWLILALVILFVGFPSVYSIVSTYLHIPILLMLLGIILRGTAFVFKHYDAVEDGWQKVYDQVFVYSSLLTPFFFGLIAGTLISGNIPDHTTTFAESYISPWLSPFPIATGIFTVVLFGMLAAIYLTGETEDQYHRRRYEIKARVFNVLAVVSGGIVVLAGWNMPSEWAQEFMSSGMTWVFLALASGGAGVLWWALGRKQYILARLAGGAQITLILAAMLWKQFPVLLEMQGGKTYTIFDAHAPDAALMSLTIALFLGSATIFPALFLLLKTFKQKTQEK